MSVAIVMPTVPQRSSSALATIQCLISQCDQFYVHLDGYAVIPVWMPKAVHCFVHPQICGPAVRFSVVPDEDYVFFVDDDLRHPVDYVEQALAAFSRSGPQTAIAYHAAWWPKGAPLRYHQRELLAYWNASAEDQSATYVGSGTLALRTPDLHAVDRAIPKQYAFEDDVWISGALSRAGIRCVRPRSTENWIRSAPTANEGLFAEAFKNDFKRRDACIAAVHALGGWELTRARIEP